MKRNQDPTYLEILRLPLLAVRNSYLAAGGPTDTEVGKDDMSEYLAGLVRAGRLTVDAIRQARPAAPGTPVGAPQAPGNAAVQALSQKVGALVVDVAQARQTAAANAAQITAIHGSIAAIANDASSLRAAVTTLDNRTGDAIKGIAAVNRDLSTLGVDLRDEITKVGTKVGEALAAASAAKQVAIDPATVRQAVAERIEDAFAPFRQAVERSGTQAVVADLASIRVIDSKPALDAFGVDVKDVHGNQLMVEIWNSPDAPAVDPLFIWQEDILRHLLQSQATGENLWFGGEKSTGKSETARQFAARTGRSFKRINFHKYSTAEEIVGAEGLKDGNTVFKLGDFLIAYHTPGCVTLLDEPTNTDPGELAILNGFLEPDAAVSFGRQVHRRAPGALFLGADNTLGSGDESGRYVGTRTMNDAFMDRFARVIPFAFLPLQVEVDAVVGHTGCNPDLARLIIDGPIRMAREKTQTGDIVSAPSLRQVVAFIRALQFHSVEDAWVSTIASKQPAEGQVGLEAVRIATLNSADISVLI